MQGDFSAMNFAEGVEKFTNGVLFLAGEGNILTGPEFQRQQMNLFRRAEMVIIKDTGHFMFSEKAAESVAAVRFYFNN